MRAQSFLGLFLLPLFFANCLNSNSDTSQIKQDEIDSAQSNRSNTVDKANKTPVAKTSVDDTAQAIKETQKTTQTISIDELMSALPNLLGNDFFLFKSSEPSYLIGDFNGDGYSDAAIIVGAQDRYGEPGELVNPVENLCYLSVDVSFQNIINGSFVPARPKQNCGEIEKKKTFLRSKQSQYGLFIVFGDKNGLQDISRRDDAFGQKFLLLDAVYKNENIEKVAANATNQFAVKIKGCVPQNIKSDLISSVNPYGGTMAIYFDNKKFNSKECGD